MSDSVDMGVLSPTYEQFAGMSSYFGGKPPLSLGIGYFVVLGFGAFFSIITTIIVYLGTKYGKAQHITSEHFNTAGRMVRTGLTGSVIVSSWTWAATLLQSSNVAWQYGVSGPFWYASGATIQVILFGVIAINLKKVAPSAHTVCEIVNARWGKTAHVTFLFFCFCANLIVNAMLILGGASVIEALTGMDYRLASFLIPWGVILYTAAGGLQAAFLSAYLHTAVIYGVLVTMIFVVYIKVYSSDQIYDWLENTVSKTPEQCEAIFSYSNGTTFYEQGKYTCGPVDGNRDGSYLTMLSSGGLMFGIINIVGNFGTVFVDQAYWMSAIAARPTAAARGYFLGGICWFSIPFSLATSLGLAAAALMLPITSSEADSGLVPAAVATELLGKSGAILILVMLFMAITSTGTTESLAVASLVAYDIYRTYFNPEATGDQILFVSRVVVVIFGLVIGATSIVLYEIGLSLGWVYLFMGVVIGSAVIPLWNLMTWNKASGTGAVVAAWTGLVLAVTGWLCAAKVQSGEISVAALGTNEVMLSGNLIAILSSGAIHYIWSVFIDPQEYDFSQLDTHISLVEEDMRGLSDDEKNPVLLAKAERWIKRRGYILTLFLVVIWPILSIPAGVFTSSYFSFWVLISLAWGFGAAMTMVFLPVLESSDDISLIFNNMSIAVFGRPLFDDDEIPGEADEELKKDAASEESEKEKPGTDDDINEA